MFCLVPRDLVRILFTIAALNELDVRIGNASLNTKAKKRSILLQAQKGEQGKGKMSYLFMHIMVWRLQQEQNGSITWLICFDMSLRLSPCLLTTTHCSKEFVKKDGRKYFTYILVYVEDHVPCIGENPDYYMNISGW